MLRFALDLVSMGNPQVENTQQILNAFPSLQSNGQKHVKTPGVGLSVTRPGLLLVWVNLAGSPFVSIFMSSWHEETMKKDDP